jgi:transcriptional regulator with XRE-family HTH domain
MAEDPHSTETIGERLKRLRQERGRSQRELSEPGVSYAYISRIEAGARRPSVRALRKLARKLGVSAEYLETGRELRAEEERELRLADAEVSLRLEDEPETAAAQFERVLTEAEGVGDLTAATRARIGLGLAALRRGDYLRAVRELEAVTQSAQISPRSEPEPFAALAQAYAASGAPERSVDLLDRCLTELAEAGSDDATIYVRFALFLSYALTDRGELARARTILDEALARVPQDADPYMRVRLFWSQARLAAAAGEPERALGSLRRAIALLEETEDRRQLGRAHVLYAEIATLEGEASEAATHLEHAEALLGPRPDAEDLRWLRTEQARVAAQIGPPEEAIRRAEEALDLIGDADPAERGAALWALAEAQAKLGKIDPADHAFRDSVTLLREQHRWHEAIAAARSWAQELRQAGRESDAADVLEQVSELALSREQSQAGGRLATGARSRAAKRTRRDS